MGKGADLARSTLMIGAGQFASRAINLAMLPVYTRFLDPSQYGTVDLITTIVSLVAPFLTLGVESAVFRQLIDARSDPQRQQAIVSTAFFAVILAAVPLCLAAGTIGAFLHIQTAPWCAAYLLTSVVGGQATQAARGLGRTATYAFSGIAGAVATVGMNLWLVVAWRLGVEGMLASMIAAAIVTAVVTSLRLPLRMLISWQARDRRLWRDMIGFSGPLVVSGASWWVITLSDRAIIAAVLTVSATGVYGVANRFALVLDLLCGVFALAWAESASLHIAAPDRDTFFNTVLDESIRAFGGTLLIGTMATAMFFPILTGPEFHDAYAYIPPLLFGAFLHGIANIPSGVYTATRLSTHAMTTSILAAAVNLAINLVLIRDIGIWAAALSTITAFTVMVVIRFHDLRQTVAFRLRVTTVVSFSAAAAAVTCCYYLKGIEWTTIGCVVTVVSAMWLNRHIIRKVKTHLRQTIASASQNSPALTRAADVLRQIQKTAEFLVFETSFTLCHTWARRGGRPGIIMMATPEHGNLGDHAIVLAEKRLLTREGFRGRIVEISNSHYLCHTTWIQTHIAPDDLIIIDGGGNLGTTWANEDDKIAGIIHHFSSNKIVVFPQTCHYDTTPDATKRLRRNQQIYSAAHNLTLMLRDQASYAFAQHNFPDTKTFLVPDIVLSITNAPHGRHRHGVLVCLRTDREKANDTTKDAVTHCLEQDGLPYRNIDTVSGKSISRRARRHEVRRIWHRFSRASLVITDRLHGMIFAAITNTPCIAFDNTTNKVRGTYEFLRDLPYIRFLPNSQKLNETIDELADTPTTNRFIYPRPLLSPYGRQEAA